VADIAKLLTAIRESQRDEGSEWCGAIERHGPHGWWAGVPSVWHWCAGVTAVMVSRTEPTDRGSGDD